MSATTTAARVDLPAPAPTNTHILFAEFDYVRPAALADVCALLAERTDEARLVAGGTDLLVQMKLERRHPALVVSLAEITELQTVVATDGLSVGATATIRSISRDARVRTTYRALAEACDAFSTVPIMIMSTLGGNLCNASPAADTAPALLALDANVRLVSSEGERTVPLDEFFLGPGSTVVRPDEVLRSVELPGQSPSTGSAFLKVGRVSADISKVSAAVRLVRDGERIVSCRIALGAVAPTPLRARAAESQLTGELFRPELADEAAALVSDEIAPITDVRSTEEFRRQVGGVIVRDALIRAWSRASGEEIE